MPVTPLEEANLALKKNCERVAELMDLFDGEKNATEDQVKSWSEEFDHLKSDHPKLKERVLQLEEREKWRGSTKGLISYLNESQDPMQFSLGSGGKLVPKISVQLCEDPQIKSWWNANAPTGTLPNGRQVSDSPALKLSGSVKTLFTGTSTFVAPSDVNAAAMIRPVFRGLVDETIYQIPLGIADLVTHEPTDSDIIFYARVPTIGSALQAATAVPEAIATGDGSGLKPEGGIAFEIREAVVRTIAVWVPTTRKALANAPQLQGVIDRYLRYEVQRALSSQILNGNNTGEQLMGVYHLPNRLTQPFVTDIITTGRKAITNLILNGRTIPTAWVFHPSDFETIDLQTDNELRYYFGGPAAAGGYAFGGAGEITGRVPTFWGVPVRQSEVVTLGQPVVADWTRYVVADREETTMRVSDSHADFFTRNMLAVLCEIRVAGYAERDQAFCIVATS